MTTSLAIDAKTSALLVMDVQQSIVEGVASAELLLDSTAELIRAARAASMRVIHVVVGFRAGHPEVSPRNAIFSTLRQSGRFAEGDAGMAIHPRVAPLPTEVIVTKHRVGAFAGTDLDMILRANGIETIVLAGIATSGVVLSTVRHAADTDYRIVVVEDCCADRDPEVHRVLVGKVFPRQSTVTTMRAVVEALSGYAG